MSERPPRPPVSPNGNLQRNPECGNQRRRFCTNPDEQSYRKVGSQEDQGSPGHRELRWRTWPCSNSRNARTLVSETDHGLLGTSWQFCRNSRRGNHRWTHFHSRHYWNRRSTTLGSSGHVSVRVNNVRHPGGVRLGNHGSIHDRFGRPGCPATALS